MSYQSRRGNLRKYRKPKHEKARHLTERERAEFVLHIEMCVCGAFRRRVLL